MIFYHLGGGATPVKMMRIREMEELPSRNIF